MANKLKYRKAWSWPEQVEDFIISRARGFTIHIMNGTSQFGDIRIDKFTDNTDIKADALYLPIKAEVADTAIADPPWDMSDILKNGFMKEIRRITKLGGQIIINSPWCPKCPGIELEEIWCPTWQLFTFHNIALIWVLIKVKSRLFEVSV